MALFLNPEKGEKKYNLAINSNPSERALLPSYVVNSPWHSFIYVNSMSVNNSQEKGDNSVLVGVNALSSFLTDVESMLSILMS